MSTRNESWRPRAAKAPKDPMGMTLSSTLENKDSYWLCSPSSNNLMQISRNMPNSQPTCYNFTPFSPTGKAITMHEYSSI